MDLRPQPKEMGLGSDLGIVQSPIPATESSSSGQEEFLKKEAEWDREMMKARKEMEQLKADLMAKETEIKIEMKEKELEIEGLKEDIVLIKFEKKMRQVVMEDEVLTLRGKIQS